MNFKSKSSCNILTSVADPGCLSRIRLFSIPDPNCLHPGSRILIKDLKKKKLFLSSKKYDPGLFIPDPGSRFRMLTFYTSRIPDPWVKKAPDPGSGSATLILTVDGVDGSGLDLSVNTRTVPWYALVYCLSFLSFFNNKISWYHCSCSTEIL